MLDRPVVVRYFQLIDTHEDVSAKQLVMSCGYLHMGSAVKPLLPAGTPVLIPAHCVACFQDWQGQRKRELVVIFIGTENRVGGVLRFKA